ncbi:GNAT family N-acetyltransferase [Streptomyces sp. B-S-A12]|uniref:GNAT family N-acetyltransferase n=2 Tax=Streptomyces luteolus TaxID=3043615 RepID=A0ABT6TAV7_9ACTN|nr:GNAT family N-acetyltransferase [Streptomyces sp. B-S-A12]MDI3424149.1 GNAT family N-acetyltransferase [Streptomyces sp. B-S-A12]
MEIRKGRAEDIPAILALLDSAAARLVTAGRTTQWGTQPLSTRAGVVRRVHEYVAEGTPWLAEIDSTPAGTLILTSGPGSGSGSAIAPAAEPEQYVHWLATGSRFTGRGVGAALLAHAAAETRAQGLGLLRVDCYAGGDGRLVAYYESQGFTRTETYENDGWRGQVLERRL